MNFGSESRLVRALNKLVLLTRASKPAEPNAAIRAKVLTTAEQREPRRKGKKRIKRNVITALIVILSLAILRKIA